MQPFITKVKLSLLLVCLLSVQSLFAEQPKTYTFGVIVFPPLSVILPGSKECVGEAIDRTRHIIESSGHQFKFVCAPPARIYKMMELGQVDFTINVKSTKLLKPHTTFVEPLFTLLNLQMYEYEKDAAKTISGIRGFDYLGFREKLIEEGYTFSDLSTPKDSVAMFFKGRTKALITYQRPISHYLKNYLGDVLPKGIIKKDLLSMGTYYGVSKQSKHHDELITLLQNFIKANGAPDFISYRPQ